MLKNKRLRLKKLRKKRMIKNKTKFKSKKMSPSRNKKSSPSPLSLYLLQKMTLQSLKWGLWNLSLRRVKTTKNCRRKWNKSNRKIQNLSTKSCDLPKPSLTHRTWARARASRFASKVLRLLGCTMSWKTFRWALSSLRSTGSNLVFSRSSPKFTKKLESFHRPMSSENQSQNLQFRKRMSKMWRCLSR